MILGPRSWWRHRTWTRVDAKLVDSRFVHRYANDGLTYQTWDYMVETVDADGRPTRLVIREHSFKLDLPDTGKLVPILVNRGRTKAVFNMDGTDIDVGGKVDREKKLQKERDKQRFEEKLRETGDA